MLHQHDISLTFHNNFNKNCNTHNNEVGVYPTSLLENHCKIYSNIHISLCTYHALIWIFYLCK